MFESPTSTSLPSTDGEVVVLVGGDAVDGAIRHLLPPRTYVIAADSGLAAADVLGLTVDRIVGDLDSVDPHQLAAARAGGIPVDDYPTDKDLTDLAIAMDTAIARDPNRITVVGGHGGRLDHLLANAALLAAPAYAGTTIVALMGPATVSVIHGSDAALPIEITGQSGDLVSLIPAHGDAHGVSTDGLRFPLDGHDLAAGSSRGVSNELTGTRAAVALRAGVLLVVQPGAANH